MDDPPASATLKPLADHISLYTLVPSGNIAWSSCIYMYEKQPR